MRWALMGVSRHESSESGCHRMFAAPGRVPPSRAHDSVPMFQEVLLSVVDAV